jgi:hypothetical protein
MSSLARRTFLVAITCALGCAPAAPPAPPARCPEAPAPSASAAASVTPPKSDADAASLAITITPSPSLGDVEVEIEARAKAEWLMRWSVRDLRAAGATFKLVSLRDDKGPIAPRAPQTGDNPRDRVEDGVLVLERPPVGAVHLAYALGAPPALPNQALPITLDPNHFEGAGEALLALPEQLDHRAVAASIHLRGPFWEGAAGASSFGFGTDREVTARGNDLRFATFLVGPGTMGHALFESHEGHDEAVWLGYTAFDPRPISADIAAFRTAVRGIFEEPEGPTLTLLIVADGRSPGSFRMTRRAASILAHVGAGEPWSGPVRISAATEVIHGWLGSRLWVGPSDRDRDHDREAEGYWFSEGLARGLARDLLFRFGLISSAELLDEMHGLAGVAATSPRRGEDNRTLAAHVKEPGAVPLLVARGALYEARVEARLRKKSDGKTGLPELLRALYKQAKATGGGRSPADWVEALTAAIDASEKDVFEKVIGEGALPDLPEGVLGPCFQGAPRTYAAFDLGFDEAATRADPSRALAGLRPGGPAERAGLRVGDVVVEATVRQGRADAKVTIVVERKGVTRIVSYLPAGPTAAWRGWVRKRDVAEEACTK